MRPDRNPTRRPWFWVAAAALFAWPFAAFMLRPRAEPLPVLWEAPEFAFTTHEGGVLRRADLLGGPWIATFVYTRCPDVCPLIAARTAALVDAFEAEGLLADGVRFVSFTVDPEHDDAAALAAYAARFGGAEVGEWALLTGPAEETERLVAAFRLPLVRGDAAGALAAAAAAETGAGHGGHGTAEAPPMVVHSDRFVLVDARGRVRATYQNADGEAMARLPADVRALLRE